MNPETNPEIKAATIELLRTGRDRVARGWCQGSYAKKSNRYEGVLSTSPEACSWCATGAIGLDVTSVLLSPAAGGAYLALEATRPPVDDGRIYTVAMRNDRHDMNQEMAVAWYDRAIAWAEAAWAEAAPTS